MIDQVEIHGPVQSKDVEERRRAVKELINMFSIVKDKEHAWSDISFKSMLRSCIENGE